jgi:RiboL-PSP-HEPN
MSVSRRFKTLVNRLGNLRVHFLPGKFNPIGKYSRREDDLARAYVVLAHAELEAYIEDRASEIAHRAEINWQTKRRHSQVIRKLCASHNVRANQPWMPFTKDPLRITSALQSYKALVGSNHGIKETNLMKLVFPLGIQYQTIDPALINDLDTFGSFRGGIAHSSIKTQQPIDIEGQYKKVEVIIKRLKAFDRKINNLR